MSDEPTGQAAPDHHDPAEQAWQRPWQSPGDPQQSPPPPLSGEPAGQAPRPPGSGNEVPGGYAGYPTAGAGFAGKGYAAQGYPTPVYPAPGQPGYPTPPAPKRYTALIVTVVGVVAVLLICGTLGVSVVLASRKSVTAHPTAGPLPYWPGASAGGGSGPTGGGSRRLDGRTGLTTSGIAAFGTDHSVQWKDNVEACVVSVTRFTPSQYAAGAHAGQAAIKVTVRISNKSSDPIDLTLSRISLKVGTNGTQGAILIDPENNLGMGFEGPVAPDHSATATYGFAVAPEDLGKIDVEVSPTFEHETAIFEGQAT